MADEVLFVGGRSGCFFLTGAPTEVTTAGRFDSAYADCAVQLTSNDYLFADFYTQLASVLSKTSVVSGESVHVHFDCATTATVSTTSGFNLLSLLDPNGVQAVIIQTTSSGGAYGLFYYNGSSYVQIGSSWSHLPNNIHTYDVKVTLGSPHYAEVSFNGAVVASGNFTYAPLSSLVAMRFRGSHVSTAFGLCFSQIAASRGIPLVGAKIKTIRATGAGANSGWDGSYTQVAEAVNSDTTVNRSVSSGQKQTYAMGDVTVPVGFGIKSVFHWMRAKQTGFAPTKIRSLLRSGTTDYSTGDLSGIDEGYNPVGARYDKNPATGADWTQSTWNSIEAGFESAN